MQYKEAEQRKIRDESILKSLERTYENGKNCPYSEEQILEAQQQLGQSQVNDIYTRLIHPAVNSMLFTLYILANLIIMPIVYVNDVDGVKVGCLIAYLLMILILIIVNRVQTAIKNNTEKRVWMERFEEFSNHTYIISYLMTSMSYFMVVMNWVFFGAFYIIMVVIILISVYYVFVKPLKGKIWKYIKNLIIGK